ncbi:MAG: hypothetical protein PHT54_02025 [Candidatus Nanoarchaeia archaeon]|nr:hypothetical protein [Candidatus Nanoarchaeia archaeon]
MRTKKLFFLGVLILLMCIPFSFASYDSTKAGTYLIDKSNNGNFNSDIVDSSVAGLALKSLGYDTEFEQTITYIKSKEDGDGCWPKNSCKIKDTAFSILALESSGRDIDEELNWLVDAQSTSSTGIGTWWLQIATEGSGNCTVKYTVGNRSGNKEFEIKDGKFPGCSNKRWLDIGNCIVSGLLGKGKLTLNVDCSELGGTPIISTIFQSGDNYYLFDDQFTSEAELTVRNTCYGTSSKSTCDYSTSLYANWVLKNIGNPDLTLFYLYSGYSKTNEMDSAVLALVDGDLTYFEDLKAQQKSDGSFNGNIEDTAFAVMALANNQDESFQEAMDWLSGKQKSDGSFGSVYETGLAVYAISLAEEGGFGCVEGSIRSCSTKGVCVNTKITETCTDGAWSGCDYDAVKNYESSESSCSDKLDNDCDGLIDDDDDDCEAKEYNEEEEETSESVCGDGICDFDEDSSTCSEDCETEETEEETEEDTTPIAGEEEGGGFPWWIIIFILILAGGIYIYYTKFYKKSEKKEKTGKEKKPGLFGSLFAKKKKVVDNKPILEGKNHPAFHAPKEDEEDRMFYDRKSALDKELEKSLEEAQKLIGGKK